MENKSIKLDFGSGIAKRPGYITIDSDPAVGADSCFDLEQMAMGRDKFSGDLAIWDYWNCGVDEIRAHHFLEHTSPENKVRMMHLIFDLLKPGGIVDIEVPCFPHDAAVQDPTHISFWNKASFWYFTKGNRFGEAFAKRCSTPVQSPLFEFVSDSTRISAGQTQPWAYGIILKKTV